MRDKEELSPAHAGAASDEALAAWVRDLTALRDNLRAERARRGARYLQIMRIEARALIEKLTPPSASRELSDFVLLLDDVRGELRHLGRHGLDGRVAEVTTAVPLTDEERSSIERWIVSRYGRGIAMVCRVAPAIIGGVVIRVGDEIIDDSVATRLETLRESLKGQV